MKQTNKQTNSPSDSCRCCAGPSLAFGFLSGDVFVVVLFVFVVTFYLYGCMCLVFSLFVCFCCFLFVVSFVGLFCCCVVVLVRLLVAVVFRGEVVC